MKLCECGCGQEIQHRRFVHGHNSRLRKNEWSAKPDSQSESTGRWRAKKICIRDKCHLEFTGECSGKLEVHHKDKNPLNNDHSNLMSVCTTHHRLLDLGRITEENPRTPKFYVDGSGKRRYVKT